MFSNCLEYATYLQVAVGITTFMLIYLVFFSRRRNQGLPPGPTPFPIIGNLHQLGIRPFEAFMKLGKVYGPIFSVDYASFPAIVLNDHQTIRKVFNDLTFSGRPQVDYFKDRTGGKTRGIILTQLETWTEQRRFLIQNLREFGFGKKTMEGQIMEAVQGLVTKIKAAEGTPIKTENLFEGAVLSSFWKIVSGEVLDEENAEVATLIHSVTKSFADLLSTGLCFYFPTLNKVAPSITGYKTTMTESQIPLWQFLQRKIAKEKQIYQDGQPPRNLFEAYFNKFRRTVDPTSSFYGEEGEKQLAASTMDLFMAGMETTSTTLNWIFLILALYPEIQSKVYNEIEFNIKSRLPTIADRGNMPYTECFMMEVNRFTSLVPMAIFHTTTQNTELDGYEIPKETWVTANLYGVMHDPEVWGDPEVIRPERFFTPEGEVDRHHPAYMPFSTGKRRCIGEALAKDELFLFLTSFCQIFWVKPNPGQAPPTLTYHPRFTLSPKPHSLVFELRKCPDIL